MPDVYSALTALNRNVQTLLTQPPANLAFSKPEIRGQLLDDLLTTALFSVDPKIRFTSCQTIYRLAELFGVYSSSLHPLYTAFGQGKVKGFTVPAINIRTLTYDIARLIFRLIKKHQIGVVIFEIARSEIEYTKQQPSDYAIAILTAAMKEDYQGPVFLQGDHYQVRQHDFADNQETELTSLKQLIEDSLEAKFRNIDIDASTLVNLKAPSVEKQQELNSQVTALFTELIRAKQPKGETVSIGGEIGHIGGKKSSLADLTAFMDLYAASLPKGKTGLSKISIQTGTSHGGTVLPDGSIKPIELDFTLLHLLSAFARRKYKLGGAVQHGASTLPLAVFDHFVANETLEVHLSTGLQNIVFEHLPESLKKEMYSYLTTKLATERQEGQTEKQFLYTTRKIALGQFKKELWDLTDEEKSSILTSLETFLETIFLKLKIKDTKEIVQQYIP